MFVVWVGGSIVTCLSHDSWCVGLLQTLKGYKCRAWLNPAFYRRFFPFDDFVVRYLCLGQPPTFIASVPAVETCPSCLLETAFWAGDLDSFHPHLSLSRQLVSFVSCASRPSLPIVSPFVSLTSRRETSEFALSLCVNMYISITPFHDPSPTYDLTFPSLLSSFSSSLTKATMTTPIPDQTNPIPFLPSPSSPPTLPDAVLTPRPSSPPSLLASLFYPPPDRY